MQRAPLPAIHQRRWKALENEDTILPALPKTLKDVLHKVTAYYDHPGRQPPQTPFEEQQRLL